MECCCSTDELGQIRDGVFGADTVEQIPPEGEAVFLQVFFKLAKVSRYRRPSSKRVEPLTFRLMAYSRISFSLRLLFRGISGLSRIKRSSYLLFASRFRAWLRVWKEVRVRQISSKRALSSCFFFSQGHCR